MAKIVSGTGKVTGQYKYWFNKEYLTPDSKYGELSSLDISKTRGLSVVSNTDVIEYGQGTNTDDNSKEILIADVSADKPNEQDIKSWTKSGVYTKRQPLQDGSIRSSLYQMVLSPCIMCVQYIGGCSIHRGDIMSTSGGVQYIGGIP